MATLESSLVILDRASGPVRGIRREVRGLHSDAEKAGRALDDMAGPKAAADLEKVAANTRVLRGALRGVRDELPILNRGMDAYSRRVDIARRNTDKLVLSTDRLSVSLRTLGAIDAHPRVQIDGLAQSRVELAALRAELRAFGSAQATARARIVGSSTGLAGGGRGGGQTAAYFGTGGAGIVTTRIRVLAGATVAALPVVQALGGATVALTGSLAGAGLGGGAVGVAGGGVLAAGLGSVVAVAKPAQKAMEDATKAQEAYTTAVRENGKWSKEAAHAQRDLAFAYRDQPGLRRATAEVRALNREWKELTAPGRQQWFGLRGDIAQVTRRAAPQMARNANTATAGVRKAGTAQARFLAGGEMQDTLAILTREFARDLPIAEHALEGIELVLARTARASRPFFREGIEWIDQTTAGWAQSTKDVGKLRREIGGYVEDLKDWGDLTGSAFELVKDVLMGGRPAGGSAVEDLTKTLDRWDRWVERNPEKMDRFFRNAVSDTAAIAESVVDIVQGLNAMATTLRPLLGPLTAAGSAFGALAGGLSPGVAATAFLGLRAGRQRIANRGGGSTSPGGALVVAGGGAAAARAGPRTNWTGWTPAQSQPRGRFANLPGQAAGAGKAVGRFALPALAIGGLTGALGQEGVNEGRNPWDRTVNFGANTVQGALAMFGIGDAPMGTAERQNRGMTRAQSFVAGLPGGDAPTARQAASAARGLAPEIASAAAAARDARGGRHPNDLAEAEAYLKALRGQAQAYRDIAKEAKHAGETERNQRSREHAGELTQDFGKAFDILAPKHGIEGAMDKTVRGVYKKMRGMNRTGAKILGENTLAWARQQAKSNPALLDEVEWLNRRIRRGFSKTGEHVQVVNGKILTGSRREWQGIYAAITSQADKARQEVGKSFTAMQNQAVGSLVSMGYTRGQAKSIVKGVAKGGAAGAVAASDAKAGPSPTQLAATDRKTGDGIGDGPGGAVATRGSSSPALMGAKPALGGYAAKGAEMGLSVSSGARPGAVTSSGNTSYHASGDALDLAGSPDAMMRFAKYASQTWGSHLEELIYSPAGKIQVKNGQSYVYTGQVAKDHYDHVHIADTSPTGGGGAAGGISGGIGGMGEKISLSGKRSRVGGAPGAMSSKAMAAIAAGLESKINARLGSDGGSVMDALSGSAGSLRAGKGGVLSFTQVARLAESVGLPGITFAQIAKGESGYNPRAVGHDPGGTLGLGLWQITTGFNDDLIKRFGGRDAMFDPRTNALAAKAIYDRQGIKAWYGTRYMTGTDLHFQGDGDGWARPSAGGGGPTTINVQGGSGGSRNVTVSPNISIRGAGASEQRISSIVARHVEALAAQVLAELGEEAMVTM